MAILVVDDSQDQLTLIRSFLQSAGYDVISARSMEEALDQLGHRSVRARIDLVLLDVLMPQHDGMETCSRIKGIPDLQDIPILMISAESSVGTVQMAFKRGAIDYIRKPVIKTELLSRVRFVLNAQEDARLRTEHSHQVRELQSQLAATSNKLECFSSVDGLTGVMSWQYFETYLSDQWDRAARENVPVSLIVFLIPDFKHYNDTYGYRTGDECLQRVACAVKETLTGPDEVVARHRGAEFVVFLPGFQSEEAQIIVENIRESIEALDLTVVIKFGLACGYPNGRLSYQTLLALAREHVGKA